MSFYTHDIWYRSPIFWGIFLADRVSKMLVVSGILGVRGVDILPFLSLKLHYNFGIAWGFFQRLPFGYLLIPALMALFLIIFAHYTFERQKNSFNVTGETLIIAGGFSNFVDRIPHGPVIDFIHVHFGTYDFPIFNFADVAISLGAVIIFYNFLLGDNE